MGLTFTDSIPVLTVLVQGFLSFFSPCVLPLLPMYLAYLSGGTVKTDEEGREYYDRKKVLINTIFFVIGIAFAFFILGLGLRAAGRFFSGNQLLFARIGGILVIVFGLFQLGILGQSGFMNKEHRLPLNIDKMVMSPITALIMGFVFSFAWTPCVGPTLASVLLMSASAESSAMGFLLIGVYTAGFIIPFLLAGIFTTSLLSLFKKHRNVVRYTAKIGGVLLIFMGIMMLTGLMNNFTGYLSKVSGDTRSSQAVAESVAETPAVSETDAASEAGGSSGTGAAEKAGDNSGTGAVSEAGDNSGTGAASEAGDTSGIGAASETGDTSKAGDSSDDPDAASSAEESGSGDADIIPAFDFTLKDQYGNTHTLSDYKGKIVFLNFWATWCPPCRAEMPDIQDIYEETQNDPDSDLVILGVAFPGYGDEVDEKGVCDFLEKNGYTYPVVMDSEASLMLPYYISAYPTTYMINKDGNVFGYVAGSLTRDIMDDIIRQTRENG